MHISSPSQAFLLLPKAFALQFVLSVASIEQGANLDDFQLV